MKNYVLMHKNEKCGTFVFDEETGKIMEYHDNGKGLSPYLGNFDVRKMRKWWEMRAVPASRTAMQEIIRNAGCLNTEVYLAKNLALSMTDTYWICPDNANLSYDDVKFSNLAVYGHGKVPYHNASSYDPNASLGGQMNKYWDLEQSCPILVKESYRYFGQQSINEVFATRIHERQNTDIPFVRYSASTTEDRGVLCRCKAFTSEDAELISAYEIIESQKIRNEMAFYDAYIQICVNNGIDYEQIQNFMDYQTMTDFLISNTDEHLMNFGVLRDANTMKLIGPAPIFDSGNSMFYSDERKTPYSRADLLGRTITGFCKTEEKMLEKVKNRNLVRIDLIPAPDEVKTLYIDAGIPEWKADLISKNYETKAQMLKEFQKGKVISFYREKQREKESRKNTCETTNKQKFIMLSGISGPLRIQEAKKIYEAEITKNKFITADDRGLYPIGKALENTGLIFDKAKILNSIHSIDGYRNALVYISSDKIREEIRIELPEKYSEDLVSLIVDARIKTAFISGASVIYEAMNLDRQVREKYLEIAKECGINNRELHVINSCPPVEEEGWNSVINHQS
ncbi:MAG: hypothetical protein PUI16_11375 [Clostridia bacterium]|nr:hypothetical protein [Clostridia bacterium]MDY5556051.1 hypothetical protein [Blautia sp.]